MALDDSVLAAALKGLYGEMVAAPMNAATLAAKMAKIIDDQIKTADIETPDGIVHPE
jgi:hypothetical protein